ncbi:SusC/RagA family TonB-linked outer membrane protein [Chitinophaga arvensicola]|uniref:TonB-linked outer membrane protein, SusC/RagA family n=1 Tax=Chitinophaga arvensicola TaxID=29529 RepID=A0A1I0RV73_9BACT|nr:TonB-dependent receptor [Chitinophaga arvensicola]SEW45298.1 TonB-linked outer membrane protein, SusC/RagA family [Chitinophaga arvensicola]
MLRKLRLLVLLAGPCLGGMLKTTDAFAQQPDHIQITGNIHDELGAAIPGVSVVNLTTKNGAATNAKGSFAINARRGDSLLARLIGYEPYTFVIYKTIDFDIILKASHSSLNEVVVVGFGQQKKISLVGAQSTVNIEQLKQPVANLSASLAGRISGLVGVQRSGLPGSNSADLWIRGISTFNRSGNSASPLLVVDGVQNRDINSFDPEDISSFTILKDASATAVYGVAGANGVIIINTKKGIAGKPVLMFNYNQGISSFTKRPELTDGVMYMMLRNEAERNSGLTPEYSNNTINSTIRKEDPNLYPDVDWMDAIFNNTSQNRRANFSSRGGSDNATYYIGLAYFDEQSLVKTDRLQTYNSSPRYKRYNFTSNINMNWTKTTKFDLGIQGYISNNNTAGVSPEDVFRNVMQTNPVLYPVMYPGNLVPSVNSQGAQPNPYAQITQTGFKNIFTNQVFSNAKLTQDLGALVPGLSAYGLFSFDVSNVHEIDRTRQRSGWLINKARPYKADGSINLNLISNGSDALGYGRANNSVRQLYIESALNYEHSFGKKNNVSAMLLFNQREQVQAFAGDVPGSIPYRSMGLAGRGTYAYDNKYFAEVNFGYNGSENFAPSRKFGFFPSFGVGWVLSNEQFFEPIKPVFQFFKLRYSDGKVGDGGNGGRRFGYLTLVATNPGGNDVGLDFGKSGSVIGRDGVVITDYGTDVTWATSHKQDLGMEFKTLGEKLSLTVDVFKERRSKIFLQRQSLSSFVGLNSNPWANLGVIDNKGIEATLELLPVKIARDMTLDLRGTFSYNRDKVIENDQPAQPFPYMERRGTNYNATFGYVAEGLFTDQADIDKHADQTRNLGKVHPGDIKYKDMNGDGIIDANDMTRIGNGDVPTTIFGFGGNITWKGFYIGVFFQGVAGADRLLGGDGIIPFNNSTGPERSNLFAIAEDRWTPDNPNPNAFYPRLAYGNADNKNNSATSTWWVKDIGFLRLKTADFGYNFPKGTLKRMGLKNARLYVQGLNLFYWSKFKLWDPELNTSNGTNYPLTRSVNIGLQANF